MRLRMAPKFSPFMLTAILVASSGLSGLHAATPENAEPEYQQVRKIALRDPKVREAYEEADRKLKEKILQIDPALSDYVQHHSTESSGAPEPKKPVPHAKPTAVPEGGSGVTYVVKKGDTLSAMASHYGVTVAALKAANHIVDEKKLAVGQTLIIPPH